MESGGGSYYPPQQYEDDYAYEVQTSPQKEDASPHQSHYPPQFPDPTHDKQAMMMRQNSYEPHTPPPVMDEQQFK